MDAHLLNDGRVLDLTDCQLVLEAESLTEKDLGKKEAAMGKQKKTCTKTQCAASQLRNHQHQFKRLWLLLMKVQYRQA